MTQSPWVVPDTLLPDATSCHPCIWLVFLLSSCGESPHDAAEAAATAEDSSPDAALDGPSGYESHVRFWFWSTFCTPCKMIGAGVLAHDDAAPSDSGTSSNSRNSTTWWEFRLIMTQETKLKAFILKFYSWKWTNHLCTVRKSGYNLNCSQFCKTW